MVLNGNNFNSTYAKNETQLFIDGGNYVANNNNFTGFSRKAMDTKNMTSFSSMNNCSFIGDDADFRISFPYTDNSVSEVFIKNSHFENGEYGVRKLNGKLLLKCNFFTDILVSGVHAADNCWLAMNIAAGGGYNVFEEMLFFNIELIDAQYLQLQKGNNYFYDSETWPHYIGGSVNLGALPKLTLNFLRAHENQWNVANTEPDEARFNVFKPITLDPIGIQTDNPQSAACGALDPGGVSPSLPTDGGTKKLETENFDKVKMEDAVESTIALSERADSTQNDLEACALFEEILTYDFKTINKQTRWLIEYTYEYMKHTVQHTFSTGKICQADNSSTFHPALDQYVDVINFLSSPSITDGNYVKQFYLEMDKAHVFHLVGNTVLGLDVLYNMELCGVDSIEQAHLNHWKFEYEQFFAKQAFGLDAEGLDTNWVDTSSYILPIPQDYGQFGSTITGRNSVDFNDCSGPKTKLDDEDSQSFVLYPNPSDGQLTIVYDLPEGSIGEVQVHGIDGKLVYRYSCFEGHIVDVIDISSVESGIYTYSYLIDGVVSGNGKVVIK